MSAPAVFAFKPGLRRGPVQYRIGRDELELVEDGRVLRRIAYDEVTFAHWVEMDDAYQGVARRELTLKGRWQRLRLLQKDGFRNGPVAVDPFYETCAAVLRALAARKPGATVYYGPLGFARWLYALLFFPTAVVGLLIAATWLEGEADPVGGVMLAWIGLGFIAVAASWIWSLRLFRSTPRWAADDLAAEMERWVREQD